MYCPKHGLKMLCVSETYEPKTGNTEYKYFCGENGGHTCIMPHELVIIIER